VRLACDSFAISIIAPLLVNTCTELQRGKWRGPVDGDVPRSGQLVAVIEGGKNVG
jgi:hypothetical protein